MALDRTWLLTVAFVALAGSCTLKSPSETTPSDDAGGQDDGTHSNHSGATGQAGSLGSESTPGGAGQPEPSGAGQPEPSGAGGAGGSSGAAEPPVIVDGVECVPGNYAAPRQQGEPEQCIPCGSNEWDHDQSARTPCLNRSTCAPGSYMTEPGSATSDRLCEACVGGYTTADNQTTCTPWPICPAGDKTAKVRSNCIKATQIEVGLAGACATFEDGTLWCWGQEPAAMSGPNLNTFWRAPQRNDDIAQIAKLSMKMGGICAVMENQSVKCWGAGDLGDGATYNSKTPVTVTGVTGAIDVSPGAEHTCVLSSDGLVRCWGDNIGDPLGNSPTQDGLAAVVEGLSGVTAMGAGWRFGCAILASAKVSCWGINTERELGAGISDETSATPVEVSGLSGVSKLSVGYWHSCAVTAQGEVVCWGGNTSGQMGRGSTSAHEGPGKVTGLSGVVDVRAGIAHSCALLASGGVKCWGKNAFGELGDGSTTSNHKPVSVVGIDNAQGIAVGGDFSCARLADGSIKCWGLNRRGQLGIGDPIELSAVPRYVVGEP